MVDRSRNDNDVLTRDSLFDLSGHVALVTGGGSGIGLMVTQTLATNGCRVYITGRTQEKLDNVVAQYQPSHPSGEIIALRPTDVNTKEDIQRLYDDFSSRESALSILVNNAGVSSPKVDVDAGDAVSLRKALFESEESSFASWQDSYQTNVTAVFFTTAAFLPLLAASTKAKTGWSATVLNISSISGMIKSAQQHFAYNASKAAAVHVTRMLAAEISSDLRIRINSIAPGVFPSEMTAKEPSDDRQKSDIPDSKVEGIPAGRVGHEQDMGGAVLFCVTNQYLNGQSIVVDGGFTLHAGM